MGGAGKEEGGREGWTFLEHRRDKPTLRGQRVEWLRAGHQSQAIGSKSGSVLSVLWTWALLSHSEPVSSAVKYELRRLNEQARIKSLELNLARSTCSLMLVVVNIIILTYLMFTITNEVRTFSLLISQGREWAQRE